MSEPLTIGCDPEIGFTYSSGMIRTACYVIKDARHNRRFGIDGAERVAEFRPRPSADPLEVVTNLRRDMCATIAKNKWVRMFNWKAGSICDSWSIGGHIHFGSMKLRNELIGKFDSSGEIYHHCQDEVYNSPVVGFLNRFIGAPTVLMEDKEEAMTRRSTGGHSGYGYFDYRVLNVKSYGFEYRPVASWMTSPHVAAGVLSLSKVVMDAYLNSLTPDRVQGIIKDVPLTPTNLNLYHGNILRNCVDAVWPIVRTFPLYELYKKHVELVYELIKSKMTWFPSVPLKEAWGLSSDAPVRILFTSPSQIVKEFLETTQTRITEDILDV